MKPVILLFICDFLTRYQIHPDTLCEFNTLLWKIIMLNQYIMVSQGFAADPILPKHKLFDFVCPIRVATCRGIYECKYTYKYHVVGDEHPFTKCFGVNEDARVLAQQSFIPHFHDTPKACFFTFTPKRAPNDRSESSASKDDLIWMKLIQIWARCQAYKK